MYRNLHRMEENFVEVATLEKLREFLTCLLCHELFIEPQLMPCLHNFCLKCLEGIYRQDGTGGACCVFCPLCSDPKRTAVLLRCHDTRCLRTNLAVQNMAEHLRKMDIVKSPCKSAKSENATHLVIIPCSICDRSEHAVALCTVCNEYLCPGCEVFHKVARKTKAHTVVLISREGLSSTVAGNEFTGLKHLPWKCDVHEDFFADRYCRSCDKVVCLRCLTVSGHKRHDWDDASMLAGECCQRIDGCVEATDTLLKRFEDGISIAESALQSLKQNYDSTKDRINTRYGQSIEQVTAQRSDLLREAELIYQRENKTLVEQLGTLKAIQDTLHASLALTKEVFSAESVFLPTEVLFLFTPTLTRLEQLQEDYSTYDIRPNGSSELIFVENNVQELSNTIGTLPSAPAAPAPHPECFSANDINSTYFVKHKEVYLTFTCRDLAGNILFSPSNPPVLRVTLQSCRQPETVVTVMSSNVVHGQYQVAITPRTYGNHQLIVRGLDKDIQGSPFSIVVSPPLMEYAVLVNCVHKDTSSGRFSPANVAVQGETVVSSNTDSVLVFDRKLQFTRFLENDPLMSMQGIAFDSNNNLLVAEGTQNRVRVMAMAGGKVSTPSCSHIATRGCSEGYSFQYPLSIALSSEGHIFVCDAYRHINYFTPEYAYLGQFGEESHPRGDTSKDLCCIAVDKEDRILMSSHHLCKVCVFTRSNMEQSAVNPLGYTLVWSFGDFGSPSERLIGPFGIACDPNYGYVYVIERLKNVCRLAVFTSNGEYITSYHGAAQIRFSQLRGVCVCSKRHNVLLADYGRKQLMEVCLLDMR